ncbi:sialidase family protein [Actinomadura alba]
MESVLRTAKTFRPGKSRIFTSTVTAALTAGVVAVAMATPVAAADDPAGSAAQFHTATVLFKGNNVESLNGISYHTFRIPAIVRTNAGTLLAFAEGRAKSNKDYGNINLVYKRGVNDGAAASDWSSLKEAVGAGAGTWGNPTPVVDRSTGTIWLFLSWNAADKSQSGGANPDTGAATTAITKWGERRVYVMKSTNDGQTFTGMDGSASPTDMTESLLPKTKANGSAWAWDAMGPGNGIYTANGTLVIPAQHRNIYSTDHGATWRVQKLSEPTGEATITELADGSLYRNDRPTTTTWNTAKRRWVARGSIAGGFSAYSPDDKLLDPVNQASVLQYNNDAPSRTIFLNSASTENRRQMRVRISYDNARTWPNSRPLSEGPLPSGAGTEGGYSSMTKTADYRIGALVESNLNVDASSTSSRSVLFRKFNLSWILHGCTC